MTLDELKADLEKERPLTHRESLLVQLGYTAGMLETIRATNALEQPTTKPKDQE
jgi:hypothetical protein